MLLSLPLSYHMKGRNSCLLPCLSTEAQLALICPGPVQSQSLWAHMCSTRPCAATVSLWSHMCISRPVRAATVSVSSHVQHQAPCSHSLCELTCAAALSCGSRHPPMALTVFLPPLLPRSLSPEERGLMKTFHLGLRVPKSLIVCAFHTPLFKIDFIVYM